jgi:hypothetical protein
MVRRATRRWCAYWFSRTASFAVIAAACDMVLRVLFAIGRDDPKWFAIVFVVPWVVSGNIATSICRSLRLSLDCRTVDVYGDLMLDSERPPAEVRISRMMWVGVAVALTAMAIAVLMSVWLLPSTPDNAVVGLWFGGVTAIAATYFWFASVLRLGFLVRVDAAGVTDGRLRRRRPIPWNSIATCIVIADINALGTRTSSTLLVKDSANRQLTMVLMQMVPQEELDRLQSYLDAISGYRRRNRTR